MTLREQQRSHHDLKETETTVCFSPYSVSPAHFSFSFITTRKIVNIVKAMRSSVTEYTRAAVKAALTIPTTVTTSLNEMKTH